MEMMTFSSLSSAGICTLSRTEGTFSLKWRDTSEQMSDVLPTFSSPSTSMRTTCGLSGRLGAGASGSEGVGPPAAAVAVASPAMLTALFCGELSSLHPTIRIRCHLRRVGRALRRFTPCGTLHIGQPGYLSESEVDGSRVGEVIRYNHGDRSLPRDMVG
jgi:hypothetical protein